MSNNTRNIGDFVHRNDVRSELSAALAATHAAYRKAPNAANWVAHLGSMLAWQQWDQVRPVACTQETELLMALRDLPVDMWGERIVRTVTGKDTATLICPYV